MKIAELYYMPISRPVWCRKSSISNVDVMMDGQRCPKKLRHCIV
jgi:hypothetical protein